MAVIVKHRTRTVLLGFAALLALLYGLAFVLELAWRDVALLVAASVVIIVLLAVAGFVFAAALHIVKWLFSGPRR